MEQEEIPNPRQRCFIESVIRAIKPAREAPGTGRARAGRGVCPGRVEGQPPEHPVDDYGPAEPDCEVHRACRVLTRIDPCHIDCNSCMMISGNGNVGEASEVFSGS